MYLTQTRKHSEQYENTRLYSSSALLTIQDGVCRVLAQATKC